MASINLAALAYEQLINNIISLEIKPGTFLQERQLAEQLDMSRTPVREALTRLAHEGWLQVNSRRNIEVRKLTEHDIDEIFELRELFEIRGVEHIFSGHATHAAAQKLREVIETMRGLGRDEFEFIYTDQKFHTDLILAGMNARLAGFWGRLNLENMRLGVMALGAKGRTREAIQHEHMAIVTALQVRRKKDARKAVLDHLEVTKNHLLQCLREWEA